MAKTAKDDTAQKNPQDALNEADAKKADSLTHGSDAPEVSLQGFLRTCGIPADQTAGFLSFANRTLPGRRTQNDWAKAFADFSAKPLI